VSEGVRELSPGIVSDPERLSGQPSIAGRRVFASTVANAVLQGGDRAEIADGYTLTDEQIENALAWHDAGRPE
jgi:uncharacterized protein (DUF433 family)